MILVYNSGFELGWTGLELGLGGLGKKGFGPGLDNSVTFIFKLMYKLKTK
mgnify:CR=1 FL=1